MVTTGYLAGQKLRRSAVRTVGEDLVKQRPLFGEILGDKLENFKKFPLPLDTQNSQ